MPGGVQERFWVGRNGAVLRALVRRLGLWAGPLSPLFVFAEAAGPGKVESLLPSLTRPVGQAF